VPGKGGAAARRSRKPRFRRPPPEAVATAALDLLRRRRGVPPNQAELARAIGPKLRDDLPEAALGGRRLRRILLKTPGVRVDVTYAERGRGVPPRVCPVCGGSLDPIRNTTLDGPGVELGARCRACGYWTHLKRRVPVRYSFRAFSVARAPRLEPATARRSA
jgi:hypothetical protein